MFRKLPSFALVPVSDVLQLFIDSAPKLQTQLRTLYSMTLGTTLRVPSVMTRTIDYELPTKVISKTDLMPLTRLFNQVYDENGAPLQLSYDPTGLTTAINNVDSKYSNTQIFKNQPINGISDQFVNVYDYYGIPLNDITRLPNLSSLNVTRDVNVTQETNNFLSTVIKNTYNDLYGNIAIGIQTNNALIVQKQILPLSLDGFNRPMKAPL